MGSLVAALRSGREFARDLAAVLGDGWRRMSLVGALSVLAAALDLMGVAMIGLLLALATGAADTPAALPSWLGRIGSMDLVQASLVLFLVFAVKGVATFALHRSIARASEGERARLMTRLLASYQARPYEFHCSRNSSDLINMVLWHTN